MIGMRVAYASDWATAIRQQAVCDAAGIRTFDIAASPHVSFAGADLGYYCEVARADAEQARAVLTEAGFAAYLLDE